MIIAASARRRREVVGASRGDAREIRLSVEPLPVRATATTSATAKHDDDHQFQATAPS